MDGVYFAISYLKEDCKQKSSLQVQQIVWEWGGMGIGNLVSRIIVYKFVLYILLKEDYLKRRLLSVGMWGRKYDNENIRSEIMHSKEIKLSDY